MNQCSFVFCIENQVFNGQINFIREKMDVKLLSIEILDQQMFRDHGALSYEDAIEVIEDKLDLTHRDIHGLQKFGAAPRRIDIAIASAVWYNDSVQDSIDETVRLCSGKIVVICVPNQPFTDVFVNLRMVTSE